MKKQYFNYRRKAGFILIAVTLAALLAGIVMMLWNWLMPAIFGLTTISYIQAIGLFLLSKILFSGICKRGGRPHHRYWKKRFLGKWENLTDAEKEKYKRCFSPES